MMVLYLFLKIEIFKEYVDFLEDGTKSLNKGKKLVKSEISIKLNDIRILKPINRPPKIIAIGLNYADHLEEIRASEEIWQRQMFP